ncbi:MAG: hypothetical protein ACQESB_03820 [Elusimicrobiota bacterium]
MKSKTTDQFWACYNKLPKKIQARAQNAYNIFLRTPYYPSLHFKRVHSTRPIFSIRISRDYRAIGVMKEDKIIWFWIGSHADYNKLL